MNKRLPNCMLYYHLHLSLHTRRIIAIDSNDKNLGYRTSSLTMLSKTSSSSSIAMTLPFILCPPLLPSALIQILCKDRGKRADDLSWPPCL